MIKMSFVYQNKEFDEAKDFIFLYKIISKSLTFKNSEYKIYEEHLQQLLTANWSLKN